MPWTAAFVRLLGQTTLCKGGPTRWAGEYMTTSVATVLSYRTPLLGYKINIRIPVPISRAKKMDPSALRADYVVPLQRLLPEV
eukprot:6626444-Pyramimonas_sp.AAC.1